MPSFLPFSDPGLVGAGAQQGQNLHCVGPKGFGAGLWGRGKRAESSDGTELDPGCVS